MPSRAASPGTNARFSPDSPQAATPRPASASADTSASARTGLGRGGRMSAGSLLGDFGRLGARRRKITVVRLVAEAAPRARPEAGRLARLVARDRRPRERTVALLLEDRPQPVEGPAAARAHERSEAERLAQALDRVLGLRPQRELDASHSAGRRGELVLRAVEGA